jgi:hypothetical protein
MGEKKIYASGTRFSCAEYPEKRRCFIAVAFELCLRIRL